jgi:erythromycin esterase-like protein
MTVQLEVAYVQGVGIPGALLGPCAVILRDADGEHFALVKSAKTPANAIASQLAGTQHSSPKTAYDIAADLLRLSPDVVPERVVFADVDGSDDGYIEFRRGDKLARVGCRIVDGIAMGQRWSLPIEAADAAWTAGGPVRLFQIHHSRMAVFDLTPPILAQPRPAPETVLSWVREHAVPLVSCSAGDGFEDLRRLDRIVEDARVVGVGEATHATREFIQLRHRIIEYLVSEHGFTLVGMEEGFAESRDVDSYVRTGSGGADSATRAMMFFPTEELRDLIEWMRAFNVAAGEAPLGFYGIDMQFLPALIERLASYFEDVDADYFERVRRDGGPLQAVVDRLVAEKDTYVNRSSEGAWAWANFTARLAVQAEQERHEDEEVSLWRDRCMAENVQSILDLHGPTSKMVVCAHNGHIGRLPGVDGGTMGWYLDQIFGRQYVNIAMAFNEGCFGSVVNGKYREFAVAPAPEGTLERALAQAGVNLSLLDLAEVRDGTSTAEWMASRPPTRLIGMAYSYEDEMNQFTVFDPRVLHDALIYVPTSSSPHLLSEPTASSVTTAGAS